jgi:hypothetical protein
VAGVCVSIGLVVLCLASIRLVCSYLLHLLHSPTCMSTADSRAACGQGTCGPCRGMCVCVVGAEVCAKYMGLYGCNAWREWWNVWGGMCGKFAVSRAGGCTSVKRSTSVVPRGLPMPQPGRGTWRLTGVCKCALCTALWLPPPATCLALTLTHTRHAHASTLTPA